MSNPTFIKNIKVDFTGTTYDTNSLFEVSDNTGVYRDLNITFDQLTNTGPGYNFEVGVLSTFIRVTATRLTDPCYSTNATGSLNPTNVYTEPINFSSTQDFGLADVYGITQVSDKDCNDIYILGPGFNNVKRIQNYSTNVYPNKGPFDFLTSSYNQPDRGDILYIPEYDAIAYGKYLGSFPFNTPRMCIISMSGELLFESDPNHPTAKIRGLGSFQGIVDDYLYANGRVTTTKNIDCYRIHLPTMTLDTNWLLNVATNFPEPISQILPLTGSNGYIVTLNNTAYKYNVSGSVEWRLRATLGGSNGIIAEIAQDSNGDLIIGGFFNQLQYYTGSVPSPIASMTQHGLTKTNVNLDFRPFSSSFSRYTINPFNSVDSAGIYNWYGPFYLQLDSNDNIVVGFRGTNPINSNISGSYVNVSGSLAVFDPTGSMIPNWNYPQNVDFGNTNAYFVATPRVYVQEDDSIIAIMAKNTFGSAADIQYDNKEVGPIMLVSQSGVLTDY